MKVRHPGVSRQLEIDFVIMLTIATMASYIPGLRDYRLDDSMRQFGAPLHEQLDLVIEAEHLERFRHNFRLWRQVRFPRPLWPLVRETVLVETFEQGAVVSTYVKEITPYNTRIADVGLRTYLQMILKDNFVHADLHPGNIMVRVGSETCSWQGYLSWMYPLAKSLLGAELMERCTPVELSLIDVGMTAQLRTEHQKSLIALYQGIAGLDGTAIADSILRLRHMESKTHGDFGKFKVDIENMFAALEPEIFRQRTQVCSGYCSL